MIERYNAELGSEYQVEQGDFPMHAYSITARYKITVLSGDYEGSYVFDFSVDEPKAIERILNGDDDD